MTGFQYRCLVGVLVPLVLAGLGMLAKRLPRGGGLGPGWKRSDLYFGAEFTLAGVAAALVNVCELFLNPETVERLL